MNGELKDTVTISSNTLDVDNNGLWLGGDQDTVGGGWQSSQTYEGTIDEVRIYNRVLSTNEIVMLFNYKNYAIDPTRVTDANVSSISSRGIMLISLRMIKAFGVWEIIITGNWAMELPLHDPSPYKS